MSASPKGNLIVISGPSGVGKSSIIDAVLDGTRSEFSVSATTREPRRGETDGVDYHFTTREDFLDAIASGRVLEWAEYGGNLYGTLRAPVEDAIRRGDSVILDIENDGAKQVRQAFPSAVLIFITPPDLDELEKRLRGRGDTADADVEKRLAVASQQIAEAPDVYNHIVENRGLDTAITQILDILSLPSAVTRRM
ncbi:MAG: guanylate kinase [Actinomycetia bacterium]|nr:guanylate kinase [Actinomycetes bacterium]